MFIDNKSSLKMSPAFRSIGLGHYFDNIRPYRETKINQARQSMLNKTKLLPLILCVSMAGCTMLPAKEKAVVPPVEPQQQCYANSTAAYMALAEANHYPSPEKVLHNARQLGLTPKQIEQSQAIYDDMVKYASELEAKLKLKQKQLDRLFITDTINDDELAMLLTKISVLETKVRYVHLHAHIQQKAILTSEQLQQYEQLSADHK